MFVPLVYADSYIENFDDCTNADWDTVTGWTKLYVNTNLAYSGCSANMNTTSGRKMQQNLTFYPNYIEFYVMIPASPVTVGTYFNTIQGSVERGFKILLSSSNFRIENYNGFSGYTGYTASGNSGYYRVVLIKENDVSMTVRVYYGGSLLDEQLVILHYNDWSKIRLMASPGYFDDIYIDNAMGGELPNGNYTIATDKSIYYLGERVIFTYNSPTYSDFNIYNTTTGQYILDKPLNVLIGSGSFFYPVNILNLTEGSYNGTLEGAEGIRASVNFNVTHFPLPETPTPTPTAIPTVSGNYTIDNSTSGNIYGNATGNASGWGTTISNISGTIQGYSQGIGNMTTTANNLSGYISGFNYSRYVPTLVTLMAVALPMIPIEIKLLLLLVVVLAGVLLLMNR